MLVNNYTTPQKIKYLKINNYEFNSTSKYYNITIHIYHYYINNKEINYVIVKYVCIILGVV